jgi:hypothetical protein
MRPKEKAMYLYELPISSNLDCGTVVIKFKPVNVKTYFDMEARNDDETIKEFVKHCGVGFNNNGDEVSEISLSKLEAYQALEILEIFGLMLLDDTSPSEVMGDGVLEPMLYELKFPITIKRSENGVESEHEIKALEFKAKTFGEITAVFKVNGKDRFYAFMRVYAKALVDFNVVMTDSFIDKMHISDYLVIQDKIIKKFLNPRKTWKKL